MTEVTFVSKTIQVEDKEPGKTKPVEVNYKAVDGKLYPAGTVANVTDRHAAWLAKNGYIEPLKKENKKAAKRETK